MSKILVPTRRTLLATFPLYCLVEPLARPRARWAVKGVYQPMENQKALRDALSAYDPLEIADPVIIDSYIGMLRAKSCKLAFPTGQRHGDEDNLRKAINDALVAQGILTDDKLVIGGENFKFFAPESMSVVRVWSVHPTLKNEIVYGL